MRKPVKGSEKTTKSGTPKFDMDRIERIRDCFTSARDKMQGVLVERNDEIIMMLTALLCKEHCLLVGHPGSAKSMLCDMMMDWLNSTKKFNILLSKFTTDVEVFGPISVKGLLKDEYRRITTNRLPEAELAFIDEVFKGSSAILNTMLKILNEGIYENGGPAYKVPLLQCIAASNEFPDAESGGRELAALFDRFFFRRVVSPIRTKAGRARLYWTQNFRCNFTSEETIEVEDVKYAQKFVPNIPWEEDAQEAFVAVIEELNSKGIFPGDRRLRKSVNACRGYAFLCGDEEVSVDHIEICKETLWDDHNNQPSIVYDVIVSKANPSGMAVSSMLVKAEDIINKKTPADAVPALQELQKDLKKLKEEPRKAAAMAYLSEQIEALYIKITGRTK